MTFLWPAMLLLLLAHPVGIAAYVWVGRRRRRRAAGYGLPLAAPGSAGGRRVVLRQRVTAAYTIAGLAILGLALARPEGVVSLPRVEGTVVLAFDVSGSMAATDAPGEGTAGARMAAAKAIAKGFVERQPRSIRLGVVAFSDGAFSTQVPTDERTAVLAAIERLTPERGTSLGRGILTSVDVIETALGRGPQPDFYSDRSPDPSPSPTPVPDGTYAPAVIVLFTDGENTQAPDPLEAAQVAADRGIKVFAVGVGSAAGTTLEVEGFVVHSALDEALLRAVAERTDGGYFAADDQAGLAAVYDSVGTGLVVRPEAIELTSLVAGLGLAVLVIGGLASLAWFGRYP
jgi:Ca-activated chloride channel family protein